MMNSIYLFTLGLFLAFLFTIKFYYDRSEYYRSQIEIITTQLEAIKSQAEETKKLYYKVQLEALAEMEKQKRETEEIINSQVPKNCRKAMRWGIEQAKNIS